MFAFALIGTMVASTAAVVGTSIHSQVEQKKQADETVKNQQTSTLAGAYLNAAQAAANMPGAIPV